MRFPNTAPISRSEKWWGLVLCLLPPIGLIAAIGLFAGQGWARWLAFILAAAGALVGVAVAALLLLAVLPGLDYPFGPWFVFLSGLAAVLMTLAAGAYWRGLRSTETEE